jgi:outer membrane protein TolC
MLSLLSLLIGLYFDFPIASENNIKKDNLTAHTIETYISYAEKNNPELKAAFYNWKKALEAVPQVRALPDPKFNYTYFVESVETRVGPQQHKLGISQKFPWFGKLILKGGAAFEASEAARMEFEAKRLSLRYNVKSVYYDLYFLGRAIALTGDNITLLKQAESAARTRFAAAAGKHRDVIRLQIELAKLEDQLISLQAKGKPVDQALKSLLNLQDQAPLPFPKEISVSFEEIGKDKAWQALLKNNPDLKKLDHTVKMARKKVSLAKRHYVPDFMLGLDYVVTGEAAMPVDESGKDPLMVMASINLPIHFIKNNASIKQARAQESKAQQLQINMKNKLKAKLAKLVFMLEDSQRKINLYKNTLIPKGEQALNAVDIAFRGGKAGFIDYIDAQRMLLKFELKYQRALADKAQAAAALDMIIGETNNKN